LKSIRYSRAVVSPSTFFFAEADISAFWIGSADASTD